MKKLILIIAVFAMAMGGVSTLAYDYRQDDRSASVSTGRGGLGWRIDRLNRMLSHVRWEVSRYRGDWRLRREVERIAGEVSRVNWRYRHGFNSWRLRREVDSLRDQLHNIEVRLRVRDRDYYRWD